MTNSVKYLLSLVTGMLVFSFLTTGSSVPAEKMLAQVAPSSNSGPIGYWNFNEGSGSTAADSSGNGNTGVLNNGPTWVPAGHAGSALSFDGVDDYVEVPGSTGLNMDAAGTVAVWFKKTTNVNNSILISKMNYQTDRDGFMLGIHEGSIIWELANSSGREFLSGVSSPLSDNTWYHVALSWNGKRVVTYLNGVQINSTGQILNSGGSFVPNTTVYPIRIGKDNAYAGPQYQGLIDEVNVYNRELFATEVKALYETGDAANAPNPYEITSCPWTIVAAGTFKLMNDVSSAGTCITIDSADVTIDLNGHTIVYGTAAQTVPAYGITGGSTVSGVTVIKNGSIIQSDATTAKASHAITLSSGAGGNFEIFNITSVVHSKSSANLFFPDSTWPSTKFHDNTVINNVTEIDNRHEMEGAAVVIGSTQGHNYIYNNAITGGVQGGLWIYGPGPNEVHDNTIISGGKKENNCYTNDFGIIIYGANNTWVHHNTVGDPNFGRCTRGIGNITGANMTVEDNTIYASEYPKNVEYGCEDAFGIQLEQVATNALVRRNTVRVAGDCHGVGLRITEMTPAGAAGAVVENNIFDVRRSNSPMAYSIGISLGGGDSTGLIIRDNTFTAATHFVEFPWDGMSNLTVGPGNVFIKGPNLAGGSDYDKYHDLRFENGGHFPSIGNIFLDNIGFDGSDIWIVPIGQPAGSWPAADEYFMKWTTVIKVKNNNGGAIAGATVSIVDAANQQVSNGTTDGNGQVVAVLQQYRGYNTTIKGFNQDFFTPHSITVTSGGHSKTYAYTADATKQVTFTFSGTSDFTVAESALSNPPPATGASPSPVPAPSPAPASQPQSTTQQQTASNSTPPPEVSGFAPVSVPLTSQPNLVPLYTPPAYTGTPSAPLGTKVTPKASAPISVPSPSSPADTVLGTPFVPNPTSVYECSDGLDNDFDNKTDTQDPDCHTDGDASNPASYDPTDNAEIVDLWRLARQVFSFLIQWTQEMWGKAKGLIGK